MESKSIDSLFRVVKQISNKERLNSKQKLNMPNNRLVNRLFIELVIFPFTLAVTIVLAKKIFELGVWLDNPALAMLTVSYFGILLHPIISIIINRKALFEGIKNPFNLLLDNAKAISEVDSKLVRYLESKPVENLKFLLLELNAEKDAFKKRISLTIGAIEKVGLIPGFFAMSVTLSKLEDGQAQWVYALAYATPALHILGVGMHYLISRLERIAGLIDYVITAKENSSIKQ